MRILEFRGWLAENGYPQNQIDTHASKCETLSRYEGDLDVAFALDECAAIRVRLAYTKDDERNNRPARHAIPIAGSIYNGTASYRTALFLYLDFSRGKERHRRINVMHAHDDIAPLVESYGRLLDAFELEPGAFEDFGIGASYFASSESALACWYQLRDKLLAGTEDMFIREDSSGLFKLFYKQVFGNNRINYDPDGNSHAIDAMAAATGKTTKTHPGCQRLHNYILSHVFDDRTMNPLLFCGVYNFAFTPSYIDPLTGKAKGAFALRFRKRFRNEALNRFGAVYGMYKDFVVEHDVLAQIDAFNPDGFSPVALRRFRQRAKKNWSPIFEIPD